MRLTNKFKEKLEKDVDKAFWEWVRDNAHGADRRLLDKFKRIIVKRCKEYITENKQQYGGKD